MTPNEETKNIHEEHVGPAHQTHEAHQVHHTHGKAHKQLTTPVAIIIGAMIIAVGLVGYGYVSTVGQSGTAESKAFLGKAIGTDEPIFGVSKKVFVIEYSDTECPYCVQFNPTHKGIR